MLADWLGGVRCIGGVTLFQAFLRNVGTCRVDAKGEVQVGDTTRMSVPMPGTGAERLVVVMKRRSVERRGRVIQSPLWVNPKGEEPVTVIKPLVSWRLGSPFSAE